VKIVTKTRTHIISVVALALLLPVILPAITLAQPKSELPQSVIIATLPRDTSLNGVGSGFAEVITSYTPMITSDRPYPRNSAWIPLLNNGSVDMGVGDVGELSFAYRGKGEYADRQKNLRTISMGTAYMTGYIVRADSGIKTVADLRGKRVTVEASMVTKTNMLTMLRAAGLEPERDVTLVSVAGAEEGIERLVQGQVDAAYVSTDLEKIKEAGAKAGGIYWLSVCGSQDDEAARLIRKNLPATDVVMVKAGSVAEVKNDCWFLQIPLSLITHKGLSDEAVYQITKAIWENQQDLTPMHPMLNGWVKNMASGRAVIPYHPGAIRFYKEAGAWSDKLEKLQQELLSE
jgi:TRAP transporter TAXI family solute receptor